MPPIPNPDFDREVRESFARQAHMGTLGVSIAVLERGRVVLSAPFDPRFTQQHGFWHAGAVASLADSACGYAALSAAPEGVDVLTAEFKLNLLAPAKGASFRADARVLRAGATLTVCSADVIAAGADGETAVAVMLATIVVRSRR